MEKAQPNEVKVTSSFTDKNPPPWFWKIDGKEQYFLMY